MFSHYHPSQQSLRSPNWCGLWRGWQALREFPSPEIRFSILGSESGCGQRWYVSEYVLFVTSAENGSTAPRKCLCRNALIDKYGRGADFRCWLRLDIKNIVSGNSFG